MRGSSTRVGIGECRGPDELSWQDAAVFAKGQKETAPSSMERDGAARPLWAGLSISPDSSWCHPSSDARMGRTRDDRLPADAPHVPDGRVSDTLERRRPEVVMVAASWPRHNDSRPRRREIQSQRPLKALGRARCKDFTLTPCCVSRIRSGLNLILSPVILKVRKRFIRWGAATAALHLKRHGEHAPC